jgi:hypothetical protein
MPATRLGTSRILGVASILFLAHDLEEAFQTRRMTALMAEFGPRLPAPLSTHLVRVRYSTKVVAAIGAGGFAAQVALTSARRRHPVARRVLRGLLVLRAANALTHIAESLCTRRYVPGTATAPLVVIVSGLAGRELKGLDARR